jgi:hypothetical protein
MKVNLLRRKKRVCVLGHCREGASLTKFGLENKRNSSIIIYSMKEMSVCLGNEEEDGEEGEDEKHGHVQLCDYIWFGKYREKQPDYYLFYERDVCVPGQ